jgi:Sap, sulfolipid-1-addressing protein
MGDLLRTMLVCGLISGTQPITIMGLLLVSAGEGGTAKGRSYLLGTFTVGTIVLLGASLLFGATVELDSNVGRAFVGLRMAIGVALFVLGVLLRRPAKKPQPEVPKALERLQNLSAGKSYAAGAVLADLQGPVLGSFAIASADIQIGGRLASLLMYTAFASGIPVGIFIVTRRSARATDTVNSGTTWIMRNRRLLASWIMMAAGVFLVGDAALTLVAIP